LGGRKIGEKCCSVRGLLSNTAWATTGKECVDAHCTQPHRAPEPTNNDTATVRKMRKCTVRFGTPEYVGFFDGVGFLAFQAFNGAGFGFRRAARRIERRLRLRGGGRGHLEACFWPSPGMGKRQSFTGSHARRPAGLSRFQNFDTVTSVWVDLSADHPGTAVRSFRSGEANDSSMGCVGRILPSLPFTQWARRKAV